MIDSITYGAVPNPSLFNLLAFAVNHSKGCYLGQRVGQAFMNEFDYREAPGFEGLWEQTNDLLAWAQIAKICEDYQISS